MIFPVFFTENLSNPAVPLRAVPGKRSVPNGFGSARNPLPRSENRAAFPGTFLARSPARKYIVKKVFPKAEGKGKGLRAELNCSGRGECCGLGNFTASRACNLCGKMLIYDLYRTGKSFPREKRYTVGWFS